MKKFICLFSLAGMLMLLSSCTTTGYVASEPVYVEYARPAPPSKLHIWVDGDWVYNRQTSVYVRRKVTGTIQQMAGSMYQAPGRLAQRAVHGQMDIGNVVVDKLRSVSFEYFTRR